MSDPKSNQSDPFETLVPFFYDLQDRITSALETEEARHRNPVGTVRFREDVWKGEGKLQGGGRTRVLEGGSVIERGGVNVSDVHGLLAEELAAKLPGESREFRASGISLVLHPLNPQAPTVHANFRVIRRGVGENSRLWFGGGSDLTPMYLFEEDCIHFHRTWQTVCNGFPDVASYDKMKEDCDKYFYLPHRKEGRGVGGIFYDYKNEKPEQMSEFTMTAGNSFLLAYLPILKKRTAMSFTEEERAFQLWRRGRYVEFNLAYDRGTAFGLQTGGRIESILMSLPSPVTYKYDYQPANEREKAIMEVLRNPRGWV